MIKIYSVNNYCSNKKLAKLATKCGFFVKEKARHTRVENTDGNFITTIPRHNKIKRATAEGIIKALKRNGATIEIHV